MNTVAAEYTTSHKYDKECCGGTVLLHCDCNTVIAFTARAIIATNAKSAARDYDDDFTKKMLVKPEI